MIFNKKSKKQKNNIKNHKNNDLFIEQEYKFVDLGEEIFINQKFQTKAIPEINKIREEKENDFKNQNMINLSYPDNVQYIHKKYQRSKFKRLKKLKQMKKSLKTIIVISLVLLIIIVYKIATWQKDNVDTKKQIDEINKEVKIEEIKAPENTLSEEEQTLPNDYFDFQNLDMINVDFSSLLARNNETVGWIKVEGTKINYPFVHTNNNDYYLSHSFNKSNNDAGWIYLDYRNNINNLSKNTIIYGHGRLNNTMFGSLKKVINSSWYSNQSNQIVRISTPTENSNWQVFSTYTIDPESYYITTDFANNESYTEFINTLKSRSVYNYNVDVTANDNILTLSSCYNEEKRVVLHAKLISKQAR